MGVVALRGSGPTDRELDSTLSALRIKSPLFPTHWLLTSLSYGPSFHSWKQLGRKGSQFSPQLLSVHTKCEVTKDAPQSK